MTGRPADTLSIVPVLAAGPMLVGVLAFGAISLVLIVATRGRLGYDAQALRQA